MFGNEYPVAPRGQSKRKMTRFLLLHHSFFPVPSIEFYRKAAINPYCYGIGVGNDFLT